MEKEKEKDNTSTKASSHNLPKKKGRKSVQSLEGKKEGTKNGEREREQLKRKTKEKVSSSGKGEDKLTVTRLVSSCSDSNLFFSSFLHS